METSFATARLPAALTPYVRSLMGASLRGGGPQRQLELPVAGTAVIVELAERWRIGVDQAAPLERHTSFAGGLTLAPAVSEHRGAFEVVEFVLTPVGTAAVLGVPAAELAHRVVALEDLLGSSARRLAERLAELPDWPTRLALAEGWLLARVGGRGLTPFTHRAPSPEVGWALDRIDATGGRVAIGALQAEIGCSRRHLAASFERGVGTTPKRYAQLVRFTGAAARLRGGGAPAEVAAACGYADQAHLTRAVQRFGATTPSALRRDGAPVTNVQDAPPAAA